MTEENRDDGQNGRNEALETRNLAAEAEGREAEEMIPEIRQKIADTKTQMPKRSKAGKIFIVLLAVFIVAAVLRVVQLQMDADQQAEEEAPALTNVQVQQVSTGDISVSSPVSGRLASSEDAVNVIPMVSGEVLEVFVQEGDYVTEGQTLFTVDDEQAQVQVQQAQLQVQQAQIGVQSAQDSVDALKTSLDRMQSLYDAGAVSLSDLESVQTQYNSALAQYDNAQNTLEQAQLGADAASLTLGYYTVTAPSSGTAETVNVVAGGPAAQSSPAVVLSNTSSLTLKADVSEYLINHISLGEQLQVYIRSLSDEPYVGTVTEIADTPEQGTYTYDVTITLNSYENMKAGMLAEVSVITEYKTGAVLVPSDAVVTKRGQSYVAVLGQDNLIEMRPVTVGIDNGTNAEITSSLSAGETIVVRGQDFVSDGEQVNVVES